MRTHLNEQALSELLVIAEAWGYRSLNHTLNKLIRNAYQSIAPDKTQDSCEVRDRNAGRDTGKD